nr:unnamed protein product [Spirometra erinaceieuropaei]
MDESPVVRSAIGSAIACLHVDRTAPYPLCPIVAMHTLLYQLLPTMLSDGSNQSVAAAVTWTCDLWLSLLEGLKLRLANERKLRSLIFLYEPDEPNPLLDHQLVFSLLASTLDHHLSSSATVFPTAAINRLLAVVLTDTQSPSTGSPSLTTIATDARSSTLFYLAFSERLITATFSQKQLPSATINAVTNPT